MARPVGDNTRVLVVLLLVLLGVGAWSWCLPGAPLPVGEVDGVVGAGGATPTEQATPMPRVPAAESERAEPGPIAAADSWALAVQVVDAFAEPVAGAQVELWHRLEAAAPFRVATADARGESRLPVQADAVLVRARADGVGDSVRLRVERAQAAAAPVVLMLLQVVQVRGLVLAGDGAPLRGATVQAEERWQGGEITRPNLTATALPTDGEGRFAFDCAVGTTVDLQAVGESGAASTSLLVTQSCEVVLACPGAFRIEGSIVDANGRPLAGTATTSEFTNPFSGLADPWFGGVHAAESSTTFSLAVDQPGRHVVHVNVPGHRVSPVEVFLSVQDRHRVVTCVAHPEVETRGTVVDAGGAPVHHVVVVAKPDDAAWGEVVGVVEHGAFALRLVGATGWTLAVPVSPGSAMHCVAGDTALRLVVAEPWAASSSVAVDVFAVDGTPPRHAVFTALRGHGEHRTLETVKPDGELPRVRVAMPMSRERWLLLAQDPFTRHAGHVWIESGERPVQLSLEPLVPLEVTVRRDGKPVRSAVVRVEPSGEAARVRVDAKGVARFPGLAHGPAVVRVLHGNAELATREIVLRTRDFAFLTIDLP
ncbi:MAG: hypothetical protein JNK15_17285 [Planctomycetes bacterium]|nr:hypothetical protein [Planctomycetota bacterium]